MRSTAPVLLLFLTVVSLRASAQEAGRAQLLDSLAVATDCPKQTPAILDRVGDVAEVHLCALVAAALDHLDRQDEHPWDYPNGRLPSDSRALVFEVHARSSRGRILESAWRIELQVPGSTMLYWVLIDQRTGRTVSNTTARSPQRRESEAAQNPSQDAQSQDMQKLHAALFPARRDAHEPWHAEWWSDWETGTSTDKASLLANLGLCGDRASYHLVDVTGDGQPELAYSGDAISLFSMDGACVGVAEGTITALFEIRGGTLAPILEVMGYIAWMGRPIAGEPVSEIVLRSDGCCGDLDSYVTFLVLADREPLSFETADRITLRPTSERPTRLFEAPRAFNVTRERYNLRSSPEIVDFAEEPERFMAAFGRGATGLAIGETTDTTGRVWWFVVMDSTSVPLGPPPSDRKGRLAGWMSSRYLEVLQPHVPKPERETRGGPR